MILDGLYDPTTGQLLSGSLMDYALPRTDDLPSLDVALFERTVYDPATGQLLSGSLMDYALPRADDLPALEVEVELFERPSTANPLGVKGSGQAGAMIAPQVVMAAVLDALGAPGPEMPATSEAMWRALRGAGAAGGD